MIIATGMVRPHEDVGSMKKHLDHDHLLIVNVVREDRPYATRPLRHSELKQEIIEWCQANCVGGWYVGKAKSVHFVKEEDAILFWMSFK